jgi:hypothetical protein
MPLLPLWAFVACSRVSFTFTSEKACGLSYHHGAITIVSVYERDNKVSAIDKLISEIDRLISEIDKLK